MNPIKQCCDTARMDAYLTGDLHEELISELEAHLTTCQPCRQALEERAAGHEIWENARILLAEDCDSVPHQLGQQADVENQPIDGQPLDIVLHSLSPTDDPEMLGRLGEYEISGVVGIGGMGAVLRGFDRSLRRVVAIKLMAPHLAGNGPARTRFQREARAAAAITHDNVIEIYGVSEANGVPYIVMPYARGPSLQKRIDRSGPMTSIEVARIGKQISWGLSAAHEQGVVHRDIKPANILLNEGIERLWITDFGVARAMDDVSMTQTGTIAGTPQFMSPEQARGESVDHRSDLFSLGSVLYTACTGRLPFRSEAAYGILRRITDTDPVPIREINPEIPAWLCQIVARLMAKHPGDRFESATEVAELLDKCLAHLQQPTHAELPAFLSGSEFKNKIPKQTKRPRESRSDTDVDARWWKTRPIAVLASMAFLVSIGAFAWQATSPPDISGYWKGENWVSVSLSSVAEAPGWYSGSFTDGQGQTGAIRLEWSRVQRRYNGTWRAGDDQSGVITLRESNNDEIRGAVSSDPDSKVRADVARLRDFAWLRSKREQSSLAAPENDPRNTAGQIQRVFSPVEGVIVALNDGVKENAYLKKEELIVTIRPDDSERITMLEMQRNALERSIDAGKRNVSEKKNAIENARVTLDSAKKRQVSFETVQRELVAGAESMIALEVERVKAAEVKLAATKSAVEQYQSTIDAQKKAKSGKISDFEMKTIESRMARRVTDRMQAESNLRAASRELQFKENDRNAKRARAQVDIDDAKAAVQKAANSLLEAENDLQHAINEVDKSQARLAEIQQRLARTERFQILAPADGIITEIPIHPGQVIQKGQVICLFQPEQPKSEKQTKGTAGSQNETSQTKTSESKPSLLESMRPWTGTTM